LTDDTPRPATSLPDTGHRVEYGRGARRESAPGKGRFDLISPIAMTKLAKLLEQGALKYEARNWELGLPLHTFVDSGMRHLAMLMMGEPEDQEDHAVAALWNMMALVHTREMIDRGLLPQELDDLNREAYWRASGEEGAA
jgi:hypothetical protein